MDSATPHAAIAAAATTGCRVGGVHHHAEECGAIVSMTLSNNGGVLATLCTGGHLHLFDALRCRPLHAPLDAHSGLPGRAVCLTADGRCATTVGDDGSLAVWDVRLGTLFRRLSDAHGPHCPALLALAASATAHCYISADADGVLMVWSAPSLRSSKLDNPHLGTRILSLSMADLSTLDF